MACKLGGSIPRALAGNSSKAMGAPAKAVRGACAAGTKPTPGPPLAAMPTGILLRSTVMTSVMSTPLLFGPCLALLRRLTEPRALVFDESRNPLLRFLLRHTVYAQFNAGVNKQQVVGTIRALREIGFGGVILGHGREMMLPKQDADGILGSKGQHSLVEQWKQASLTTLDMIGEGDFLSIKFTGAGPMAMQAMQRRQPIPQPVRDAINAVCEAAAARGVRVWIDAEQQAIQATIDDWTMDLMRRHNRNPDRVPLVYTTIQAYLRGSRASTTRHVELAAAEGWSLGVKLVRGAYIAHETRSLVHDTKDETDRAYDDIASALIERRRPGDPDARAEHGHPLGSIKYPQTALFLATHNADSVRAAVQRYRGRVEAGEPTCLVEVGQLQGMADEVGYELVQAASPGAGARSVPAAYKSLVWGSVGECLGFLYRRAVENQGAATRTRHMARALRAELRRRILCPCRGSGTCI